MICLSVASLSSYQRDEATPVATEGRNFLEADNVGSVGEPVITSAVQDPLPAEVQGGENVCSDVIQVEEEDVNKSNNFTPTPM
jgi:hypothetical protein